METIGDKVRAGKLVPLRRTVEASAAPLLGRSVEAMRLAGIRMRPEIILIYVTSMEMSVSRRRKGAKSSSSIYGGLAMNLCCKYGLMESRKLQHAQERARLDCLKRRRCRAVGLNLFKLAHQAHTGQRQRHQNFPTPLRTINNSSHLPPPPIYKYPSATFVTMGFVDFLTDAGLASKFLSGFTKARRSIFSSPDEAILTVTQRSTAG